MLMNYRSLNIDFIDNYTVSDLCADNEYYYFRSDELIKESEQISDKEFEEITSKIIIKSEPIVEDPQPTNKDLKDMISNIEETQLT
jgi:hypothetical protein